MALSPSLGYLGGIRGRWGLVLALLALALQGPAPIPPGRVKGEAGLHAKEPAWVLKEERQGSGAIPLAQVPTRPPHLPLKPQNREAQPPVPRAFSPSHLYLLYGRLQMDGG
ncbi:hypothetical protein [Thermus amyloliquefaciens]|uniref:hypothetical protein n=1 Tax=Thermus amyloliquefaciens TaxID=1449080 RepID=UPI00056F91D9|nr:hypothetical protein [Thermus amyloliquefaciens]